MHHAIKLFSLLACSLVHSLELNEISDSGTKTLANALRVNQSLTTLK